MIRTVTLVGDFVFNQGIGKGTDMAGGNPGLGMKHDCAVDTHHIGTFGDKFAPPDIADIFEELGAQWAIVIGVGQATINF